MLDADSVAADPVPVAVPMLPLSETASVLGLPESLIVRVAVRAPVALGVNVTLIAQLEFADKLEPQPLVCLKSAELVPEMAMLLIVTADDPLLDNVTDCAALAVPVFVLVNVRVLADSVTVPLPVDVLVVPLPKLLSCGEWQPLQS